MMEYPYVILRLVDLSCYEVHDTLECAFNFLRLEMRTLKCLMHCNSYVAHCTKMFASCTL